jgi:hypothetical protein
VDESLQYVIHCGHMSVLFTHNSLLTSSRGLIGVTLGLVIALLTTLTAIATHIGLVPCSPKRNSNACNVNLVQIHTSYPTLISHYCVLDRR